jgi:hypothetical protein
MSKSRRKYQLVSLAILMISVICPSELQATDKIASPPKTKCFIDVGDAHISSTILERQGRLAVKVNAISRCNVLQENVVLTVKIYKVGIGPPHLMVEKSTQGLSSKSRGLIVKNQFTYIFCKNQTKSKYYGLAYSKALINGKQYQTPPVWSENTIELRCGT